MQTTNEKKLVGFLMENPNSNKTAITAGTDLKSLVLFNVLRKLQAEGVITSDGDRNETTYSLAEENTGLEQTDEETSENAETETEEATENVETEPAVKPVKRGRDNSKFTFGGESYGKGPLVRAVVVQYVKDNPSVTYKRLKEVFPDGLLKRFGIFQDEATAREIAKKGERYFSKEEHQIKLKDKKIVVCNQFTFDNIQPFLKVAKKLGYRIK